MPTIHAQNFVRDAAIFVAEHALKSIETHGDFRLGLSGGNTPRAVYSELASAHASLPWDRIIFTFGDERMVPMGDPMSNYRMAEESLFSRVSPPEKNILRIRTELGQEAAAADYEAQLRVIADAKGENIYRHDLLLLGLGTDSHTASLFPNTPVLEEKERWIGIQHAAPSPVCERVTFTYPLINAARNICFMVAESSKSAVVDAVLAGDPASPSARVQPTNGEVVWFLGY